MFHGYEGEASHIASRSRQALNQTHLDRVTASNKDNRYLVRGFCGGERLRRTNREDYVHTKLDKFSGELRETLLLSFGVTPLDEQVWPST